MNLDYAGEFLEHVANTAAAEVIVIEAELLGAVEASRPALEHLRRLVVVGDPAAELPAYDTPFGAAAAD